MKISREISTEYYGYDVGYLQLESVIDEKLEPVEKALREIIGIEQDNNQGMQTCVEKLAEETLALFEDAAETSS